MVAPFENDPDRIQCLVPDHKSLLREMIPKKRRNTIRWFGIPVLFVPTPFDVLIHRDDLNEKCRRVESER